MAIPVRLIGENDLPAWLQAVGSLLALAMAIAIPAWQEHVRRRNAAADLLERRRAAYRAMSAVIEALAPAQLWLPGEIEGAAKTLDSLDTSIFTAEGLEALVRLQARVGKAAAQVQAYSGRHGQDPIASGFEAAAARTTLRACAKSMGVE